MPEQQAFALDEVLSPVIEDSCSAPFQLAMCSMPLKCQKCTQHQSVLMMTDGWVHFDPVLGEPHPLIHYNSGNPSSVKPFGLPSSLH